MRRARRTSARFLASALGFGVAYYFDTENGATRRKQLRGWMSRTAHRLDSVFDSAAGDPPPVFYPALRGMPDDPGAPDTFLAAR